MASLNLKLCLIFVFLLWRCKLIKGELNINVCENVADHIFIQDIKDCTKYFVCVDGQAIPQQCRKGLFFDANLQACIASRQGCLDCPKRQMLNVTLSKTCDKYILCYYGQSYLRKCDNNQQFNRETKKCDFAQNVDCVDDRCSIHPVEKELIYMASTKSCENYYVCFQGQAKMLTCAEGLQFSTKCNCCDKAENVGCMIDVFDATQESNKEKRFHTSYSQQFHTPTLIGVTKLVKCPPLGTFLYPLIGDPDYYYTCIDGIATMYACASGYQFDDKKKRCVNMSPELEVQLENDHNNNNNDNNTALTNETSLIECPEYGALIMAHNNKTKYVLCVNGNATVFDCPLDHYFDEMENICRKNGALKRKRYGSVVDEYAGIVCPKYATFTFPHHNRQKFYLCLDGKATVFTCADGQYFDIMIHGCRSEEKEQDNDLLNGTDNDTISYNNMEKYDIINTPFNINCPTTGNTTFPHAQSNQYYFCVEGKAAIFTCPEGLFYNDELKNCTEKENFPKEKDIYTPASAANIICPKFGTFKFPHKDKTKYYLCIDGKTYILACGQTEYFDAQLNICRFDESLLKAQIPQVLNEAINIDCPQKGSRKMAHNDRHKFYLCINGMASVLACTNGSYYDNLIGACRPENNLNEVTTVMPTSTTSQTDDVEESVFNCPLAGTFAYPHKENNNKYYACLDGIAITLTCPETLVFDKQEGHCRKPPELIKPKVLNGTTLVLCPLSGVHRYPHVEENKFYLCINGMGNVLSCPTGSIFNEESFNCQGTANFTNTNNIKINDSESESLNITCPKLGIFLYPVENKLKYVTCINGTALQLICPEEFLFDAKLRKCRQITDEEKDILDTFECPTNENGMFPHKTKEKFYLCLNGTSIVKKCSPGDFFDAETRTCRSLLNYIQKQYKLSFQAECPLNGTYKLAHRDANKFYLCLDGIASIHNCATGEIFNADLETCQADDENTVQKLLKRNDQCPLQGTRKLAHVDPNKYYLCIDGYSTTYSCAKGDYFDAETETCREASTYSKENNIKCPPQGSLKLPHADPNKFYLCLDGLLSIQSCLEGDFYDDETKTCRESKSPLKPIEDHENIKCPLQGSIKLPHPNPNKFYLCLNGIATIHSCAKRDFFDAEGEICRESELTNNEFAYPTENNENLDVDDIKCPPQGSLKLPHADPNKFYLCLDGLLSIQSCLEGDFYDDETKTCRESKSPSKPSRNHENIKCPLQGSIKLPHSDPNKFYLCLNGIATIHSCAKGDFFDAEGEICRESELTNNELAYPTENNENLDVDDIKCPPQGSLKHPHADPNKFYLCLDGLLSIQSCLEGDFYDDETKTCRENKSPSKPIEDHENIKCPSQGSIKLPHSDQNKFYLCLNGIATIHSCAKGDFFDAASETCHESVTQQTSFKEKVQLSLKTEDLNMETEEIFTTPKGNEDISKETDEMIPFTAENNANEISTKAETILVDCPPQGIAKLPHVTNLNKYYLCSNGIASIQNCDQGDFFDFESQTCRETIPNKSTEQNEEIERKSNSLKTILKERKEIEDEESFTGNI
ncbi:uncharacterized protein ACRADG_001928 [Cochliomyia hominivorax]